MDVAPDGKSFAVWGSAVNQLSCIDPQGKILWTKSLGQIITTEQKKKIKTELGMDLKGHWEGGWVNWTKLGLAVNVTSEDANGQPADFTILLDENGKLIRTLKGSFIGPNGAMYEIKKTGDKTNGGYRSTDHKASA